MQAIKNSFLFKASPEKIVSVITPLFNRAELITETIESVLNQSYKWWELIIIDDGSTDGADKIAMDYCSRDDRIKFIRRDRLPKGAPTCRNIGVQNASGEFLIFLDSDDVLAPFCIKRRVDFFQQYEDCDLLAFPMAYFRVKPGDSDRLLNDLETGEDDLDRFLARDLPWVTACSIWRKKSLLKIGGWDEDQSSSQDLELHIRALAENLSYKKPSNIYDCFYRIEKNSSISLSFLKNKEITSSKVKALVKAGAHVRNGNLADQQRRLSIIVSSVFSIAFLNYTLFPNTFHPGIYIRGIREINNTSRVTLLLYSLFLYFLFATQRLNLRIIGMAVFGRVKRRFFTDVNKRKRNNLTIDSNLRNAFNELLQKSTRVSNNI